MARVYGIRPWELTDLTPGEYHALADDILAMEKAAKQ